MAVCIKLNDRWFMVSCNNLLKLIENHGGKDEHSGSNSWSSSSHVQTTVDTAIAGKVGEEI